MYPLEGVRVIDLGQYIAGPCAAVVLAELGADVIKVEAPGTGDPFRGWDEGELGTTFVGFNRGKRSIELDLKSSEGVATLQALADTADVLVENFRPGVMERFGLGAAALQARNPALVYCSITGFGGTGPSAHLPAFDTVAQGYSGLAGLLLDPDAPTLRGPAMADAVTGHSAALNILAALLERARTGRGRRLEVSMVAALAHLTTSAVTRRVMDGEEEGPDSRARLSQAFVFVTGDRRGLIIHLSSPVKFWEQLCDALDRPDLPRDPRFVDREARLAHREELMAELAPIFATRPRDAWLATLQGHEVPCAPVNTTAEVLADPQMVHLGVIDVDADTPFGPLPRIRPPALFDGAALPATARAPLLGEHTEEILAELAGSGRR